MPEIAIIGSSYIEEAIFCSSAIAAKKLNPSTIKRYSSGDMRNIAVNLARLGCHTLFCTKFGNDMEAVKMWGEADRLNIIQFGPTINKPSPIVVSIYNYGDTLRFAQDRASFEFYPEDFIPSLAFGHLDYAVTDVQNDIVLENMVRKNPTPKWVVVNRIPEKQVLPLIEGVVLTYEDALQLGNPASFDRICYRLCSLGLKWIIIHMENQGIYLYQDQDSTYFNSRRDRNGYANGCLSAFTSGLLYSLSLNNPFRQALSFASEVERITFQVSSPTAENLITELKRNS